MQAAIVPHIADFDRSFEEKQPGHTACLNINIEDSAANRNRSRRSVNDIGRLCGNAGDEPKGSLDQIENNGTAGNFGVVNELVE